MMNKIYQILIKINKKYSKTKKYMKTMKISIKNMIIKITNKRTIV